MSKDAINEIRQAEAEADLVRERAEEAAHRMIADATRRAEERLAAAEAGCDREKKDALDNVRVRSEELIEHAREEAREEAVRIRKEAEENNREAVNMIYWEICEKCQQA